MRLFDKLYRMRRGEDLGDPKTLDKRFSSVDTRLAKVEETATSVDEVVAGLIDLGLQRINEALLPAFQAIQSVADVGLMFEATSDTEQESGTGEKVFYVLPADRSRFAPPAYVAIMPAGEVSPAMLGTTVSFDRLTGALVVTVDRASGTGSAGTWRISAASATDNAEAANQALVSSITAATYRNEAQNYRDGAQQSASDASDAADAATAAASAADVAADAATDAKDIAVANVASLEQVWLGAHASDPIVDNQGGALVEGAAYLNTADGHLKYFLDDAWTSVVVPVGSEVLTVFGRSGNVVATAGDYDSSKVSRTPGDVSGATVEAAIADIKAKIDAKLAAAAVSAYGLTLIDDADAATARTTLGLGTAATQASTAFAAASHSHAWADITSGKPTTVGGYGITDAYTKGQVDTALGNLVGTAPAGLDTLQELAAAIGNDTAYASTVSIALGNKLAASSVSSFMLTVLDDATAAAARATLDAAQAAHTHAIADVTGLQAAIDGKQAADATLTAVAGVTTAADKVIYFTAMDTAAAMTVTSAARGLLDDTTAAAMRTTLGVSIGADVQAYHANLAAEAGLTGAADKVSYYTGAGAKALLDFGPVGRAFAKIGGSSVSVGGVPYFSAGTTVSFFDTNAFSRGLLDDPDAATMRATLGLGTVAVKDTTAMGAVTATVITADEINTGSGRNDMVNADAAVLLIDRTGSDGAIVTIQRSHSTVGSISVTGSATAYNTSSDHRLKEIDGPLADHLDAGAIIDRLRPSFGRWRVDGSRFVGFVAHEAAEVIPTMAHGAKDEVDAAGDPVYQSIEIAAPMPYVIAELQSIRRRLAAIEGRV